MSGLKQRLSGHQWLDGSGLLGLIRRVKSGEELVCLAQSARITEAGIRGAREAVAAGTTDSEVAAAAANALHGAGSEFMSMQPIVVAGTRSSIIHTNHRRFPIQAGDSVFLELGSAYQRYTAPMMHTVVAGNQPADPNMLKWADNCRRIYETLIDAMVPGNTFEEAARHAASAWEDQVDEAFFSGVYGYTVGAQFPPSWVEGSGFIARGQTDRFEENMVFHLPLCFRLPGKWGMAFSETVRVSAEGAQPLTGNLWQLDVVGR